MEILFLARLDSTVMYLGINGCSPPTGTRSFLCVWWRGEEEICVALESFPLLAV